MDVAQRTFGDIQVVGASVQGPIRPRQEDAMLIDEAAGRVIAGVFDGVGGHRFGQEAARAAANRLTHAVAAHVVDDFLLRDLDHHVRATGGACTATIALTSPDAVTFLGVGDSMAYDRHGDPILPRDRGPRGHLTSWLGGRADGHIVRRSWKDGPFALCTDGVDNILGNLAPRADDSWVADSLEQVLAAGAPDNATLVALGRV